MQIEEIKTAEQWSWLEDGGLKRMTETLIMAAQEQAIRTNIIEAKIDRSQTDNK